MDNDICIASPSLALIKYWGKKESPSNLPATPSLAVTLGGLETETRVDLGPKDSVLLDGRVQDLERFQPFFNNLRRSLKTDQHFQVWSRNNFPSSAGLASSSSGFAALTCAAVRATGRTLSPEALSELARFGSASASRAVFGGFVLLPAGARRARALLPAEHWPELRILVAVVSENAKPVSSRTAMALSRENSPYFRGLDQFFPKTHSGGCLGSKAKGYRSAGENGPAQLQSDARRYAGIGSADDLLGSQNPDCAAGL
jgi:diphosphomevalonate decarboxylase